jgi:hypothetical protein
MNKTLEESMRFRLQHLRNNPLATILFSATELNYKRLLGNTWHEIARGAQVSANSYRCKLGKPVQP